MIGRNIFCIVYKHLSKVGNCPSIIEEREGWREGERERDHNHNSLSSGGNDAHFQISVF